MIETGACGSANETAGCREPCTRVRHMFFSMQFVGGPLFTLPPTTTSVEAKKAVKPVNHMYFFFSVASSPPQNSKPASRRMTGGQAWP